MWKGEMRAHLGHHLPVLPATLTDPLIQRLQLSPPLTNEESTTLAQATQDSLNPGILVHSNGTPERHLPAFVDNTGIAHIRQHLIEAAAASVQSAYVIFGHPDEDPLRPPCINPLKWSKSATHALVFLGYHVNTRTMMVSWPIDKHNKLAVFLDVVLDNHRAAKRSTPLDISRVLGLIRHASVVAPMGLQRSLCLQHNFNDIVSRASGINNLRRWYQGQVVCIPPVIVAELQDFRGQISSDIDDPYWCCPVGLLVPRVPTITCYTDTSGTALGGWSPESELNHMWRITVKDLEEAGVKRGIGWNNAHNYKEPAIDPLTVGCMRPMGPRVPIEGC
jgi:hypothetical protein